MSTRSLRDAFFGLGVLVLAAGCGGTGGVAPPPPPPPPTPPAVPANLRVVSAGDAAVTMSWDPVSGATSYNVYGASQAGVTKANYTSKPDGLKRANVTSPAAITGLANGKTYYFIVTAASTSAESSGSGEVNATPQPAFAPGANTQLSAGSYTYSSLNIPANVTVTLTGAVVITVTGNATIAGTLTGDCTQIEIRVTGSFTLDGLLRNLCTNRPAGTPPGIKLVADGGLIIGTTASNQDAIVSDGSIRISDSATEGVVFAPLTGFPAASSWPRAPRSNAVTPIPAQGGANLLRAARPIRAGSGESIRLSVDGPIEWFGLGSTANGTDAPDKTQAPTCDNSTNLGGNGGSIYLVARNSRLTLKAGATLQAGNGGKGGSCTAPSGCPSTAIAGKGGDGGGVFLGGSTIEFEANVTLNRGNGGPGGDANATGNDGPAACANGCHATATGGQGGAAGGAGYAITVPGSVIGSPSEGGADGGTGGAAGAEGGDGRDCNVCPAGKGGDGGNATATGGKGGNGASGNIWPVATGSHRKGNGGDADVLGGLGGKGANCCQKFNDQPGGNGGNGGVATATAGQIGTVGIGGNGTRGGTGISGGSGGNGGAGLPPGAGGAKGDGIGDPVDIQDGFPGLSGLPCPVPEAWYIYFSNIPDGPIIPGTGFTLSTYRSPSPQNPTGTVTTHFKTSGEFDGGSVSYQKNGNQVQMQRGGFETEMLQLNLSGFPVGRVTTQVSSSCNTPDCIQLIGFYQGVEKARVQSGGAVLGSLTLTLPPPNGTFPFYDKFALICFGPMIFDHWGILIIDP